MLEQSHKRWMLASPSKEQEGMVLSWSRGSLGWILRKIPSWKGLSSPIPIPGFTNHVDVAPGAMGQWWQWLDWMIFELFSNLNNSGILWKGIGYLNMFSWLCPHFKKWSKLTKQTRKPNPFTTDFCIPNICIWKLNWVLCLWNWRCGGAEQRMSRAASCKLTPFLRSFGKEFLQNGNEVLPITNRLPNFKYLLRRNLS